ncbi:MAG: polyprenyl synthetase family protein [Nitrososphaerota archaeon]|jgi:geranylgeranyl diphosphate synthase type II|nr:polyprenyl synthetase family protein [Nitrososphaerota archaeon]MDG6942123.1 polyprenyl synthetase family protein [Nitrososphaerota archaeon]MDG6942588.1 polyprenyl synthetase family protein [Nitrososphaerota archaeon]MDG6948375.1 polyprenyl synthetase family protein [Nitrososphaerota archaeon]MDG6950301.1 polyprenyl synthetase family protein [Nitrososphaerota archaeon]
MTTLQEEMKRVKAKVDSLILDQILPKSSPIREVDLLYRMMRDYPSRPAKGMRPFLCVASCRAAGGPEDDAILTAACIELFQHWILVHDDIEDGSELRRGEPALHKKYGEPLALNAGDALHARTWGALLKNREKLGPDKTFAVLEEFSRMVDETTEGQHMELGWVVSKRWDLGERDYFDMCARKTSWYTVASPCRMGALVAGASPGVLTGLKEFGTSLGIAFQIQDDALNLIGDQKKYGKAKSDDILEGKRTLILLHLLSVAPQSERDKVIAIMNKGREQKSEGDVSYVLSLIEKYDAVGFARKRAAELLKLALGTLRGIEWKGDREAASLLASFARFAVEREW